jgi:hypothetical protein
MNCPTHTWCPAGEGRVAGVQKHYSGTVEAEGEVGTYVRRLLIQDRSLPAPAAALAAWWRADAAHVKPRLHRTRHLSLDGACQSFAVIHTT